MCRKVPSQSLPLSPRDVKVKKVQEVVLANAVIGPEGFLQTLQVKVASESHEHVVRAIIDTGSQHSYVSKSLASELGCERVGKQEIVHLLFGGVQSKPQEHQCHRLHVKSLDDGYACTFVAYDQEVICKGINKTSTGPWISELENKGVRLTDVGPGNESISLLIGADIIGKLYTGRIIKLQSGPTAVETHLGWTLLGKNGFPSEKHEDSTLLVTSMFVQDATLSDLWSLDVLGIEDPVQRNTKVMQQQEVLNRFRETVKVNDSKRYEVRLPWKENHPPLYDNRGLAKYRLENSLKKLRDKDLTQDYEKVFDEWISECIIEKVPQEEVDKPGHYLPHRPVIKENSTTRIRPVFDASAKKKDQVSLNQCIETGPNLIELIPSLLLRFRHGKFGIISDIKKAFLQISVAPEDRDYLRFLWKRTTNPSRYEIYRHCRVVFGVSSSPFLLGATIDLHLEEAIQRVNTLKQKELLRMLRKSFYVDNCVANVHNEMNMTNFRELATRVMAEGGFDLREWEWTGQDSSEGDTPLLGLAWNKSEDTLKLSKGVLTQSTPEVVTKRVILSSTQKIFDPVGMVCPVVLLPKILLQKLWSSEVGWDAPLEGDMKNAFLQWQRDLECLEEVKISRWAFGTSESMVSLHLFVDASKDAYAAAVFSRVETADGVQLHLLEAKSRVAPKEKVTIPRLELLAATVGARLLHSIVESLEPDVQNKVIKYCWSDATTVLSWIHRQSPWGVFVWNRVQEIRKLTCAADWRHVPGCLNPADLPSRGCTARQLIELKWWRGWLKRPPDDWPSDQVQANEEEVSSELKKTSGKEKLRRKSEDSIQIHSAMSNVTTEHHSDVIHTLFERISRYTIIIRSIAYVQRFISNCRRLKGARQVGELTTKEVELAEFFMLRQVQKECLLGKEDTRLQTMNLREDKHGLLRLRSLVENRPDTGEFRCPIILDRQHIFVTQLIEYTHRRLNHARTDTVMNTLRERFWILSCRRAVNLVVRRCVLCNRHHSKRLETPPASLPENRVRPAGVFEVTGIDYAGPLYLREGSKVWICLFTCAIYRAVHLELVSSLSTEAFLEAFRRFVSRRGRPQHVYSDNGTNFVGASRGLREINWKRVVEYGTVEHIEWHFNPPSAAWWGGWWERLVRSVKELLRKVLKKSSLTYEELSTVLCDTESIINSRPLTYLAEDPEQLVPLSPALFLQDIRCSEVPDLDTMDALALSKRIKYRQQLRDHLRRRFRLEYLGQLARGTPRTKQVSSVRVGDVVLVGDDQTKRLDWLLGKIIQLFPGKDGVPRVARVKTMKGELSRPLQRLYPLEVSFESRDESLAELQAQTRVVDESIIESPPVAVIEDHGDQVVDGGASDVKKKSQRESVPRNGLDGENKTRRGRVVVPPARFLD